LTVSRTPEETLSDAELARRMREIERRERQLDQALAAVDAQRAQLVAIQAEYGRRRDGLLARTREVEAERNQLRADRADRVAESLEQESALH
jgi:flagellin-like hook-associated protein FlgL